MMLVVEKIIDANWAPSSTVAPPPSYFLQSDTFCPIIKIIMKIIIIFVNMMTMLVLGLTQALVIMIFMTIKAMLIFITTQAILIFMTTKAMLIMFYKPKLVSFSATTPPPVVGVMMIINHHHHHDNDDPDEDGHHPDARIAD